MTPTPTPSVSPSKSPSSSPSSSPPNPTDPPSWMDYSSSKKILLIIVSILYAICILPLIYLLITTRMDDFVLTIGGLSILQIFFFLILWSLLYIPQIVYYAKYLHTTDKPSWLPLPDRILIFLGVVDILVTIYMICLYVETYKNYVEAS